MSLIFLQEVVQLVFMVGGPKELGAKAMTVVVRTDNWLDMPEPIPAPGEEVRGVA